MAVWIDDWNYNWAEKGERERVERREQDGERRTIDRPQVVAPSINDG